MKKPSGSTRCSVQPVFAASRITLPVFGGISGATRTMWNMAGLSATRSVAGLVGAGQHHRAHAPRAGLAQRLGGACSEAPLVITSSTSSTERPRTSSTRSGSTPKALPTLAWRARRSSAACEPVSRRRSSSCVRPCRDRAGAPAAAPG
jgi:hypothetical protein